MMIQKRQKRTPLDEKCAELIGRLAGDDAHKAVGYARVVGTDEYKIHPAFVAAKHEMLKTKKAPKIGQELGDIIFDWCLKTEHKNIDAEGNKNLSVHLGKKETWKTLLLAVDVLRELGSLENYELQEGWHHLKRSIEVQKARPGAVQDAHNNAIGQIDPAWHL